MECPVHRSGETCYIYSRLHYPLWIFVYVYVYMYVGIIRRSHTQHAIAYCVTEITLVSGDT